jgi:trk system potassium uptake protein
MKSNLFDFCPLFQFLICNMNKYQLTVRKDIKSMVKIIITQMRENLAVLLANTGFVLQVSGIFILIPIVASFILGETNATLALFITATAFLVLGFMANSLCEKKGMTFKQSCTIILAVFIILSLIGSIPYLYLNITNGDIFQRITDSMFESVSGFTTTGFSVIPDLSVLPQSIILYRSMTQFIGGVGIVLVLLAFFYPEAKLREFAKSMGLAKNNHKIKKTFLFVISIYCIFTAIMVAIGYGFGYHNLINLSSIVFSAISTGGFSPVNNLTNLLQQAPFNFIIPICMIFGASNFLIFAKLFNKKFKEFLHSETIVFLAIVTVSTVLLIFFFSYPYYNAGFQVLSAMSTSGFSYASIANLNDTVKLFLVALMFIGGASFSTAGGIKIYRFLILIRSVPKTLAFTIQGKDHKVHLFGKDYTNPEVIQAATVVFLTACAIFVSSFIVCYYGFKPIDAIFDCTSAIATTGLTTGIVGPNLALELKWLFMFLMILGRVEIMVVLVIFSGIKERQKSASDHSPKHKDNEEKETKETDNKTESNLTLNEESL